jgi:cytochrome bd ubiquinol oxidase subunit I
VEQALTVHRLHFAFTVTFHYIFPQLTMGLALLIVYLKTKFLRTGDERYNRSARFWGRVFGINFAVGVVTGIPMEFQFGTNWAAFSKAAGGVIGQTLAMEGMFLSFSSPVFLGCFFSERRNSDRAATGCRRFSFGLARGYPDFSSRSRTRGCNIPPAIRLGRVAKFRFPVSGDCC